MKKSLLAVLVCGHVFGLCGQTDTSKINPLDDDTYLHPVDGITPYTFHRGEWFYAQSLQTLPGPGWAFVGVTDRLTVQLDFTPLVGGLFFKPHYPIPSLSARYKIATQKQLLPTISVEGQFFHLWDTLSRFDVKEHTLYQNGSYFHLKTAWGYRWGPLCVNGAVGVDYMSEMWWAQGDTMTARLVPNLNPNFSLSVGWRKRPWISYHVALSYGATLTYFENVPRKIQLNYGMRIAPFYQNKWRFLRNMRIELVAINAWFPDIGQYASIPLPIYPLFYWQWERRKK